MSEPDPLMSIGVFSTATQLSIKTLRRYHEHGLLVPAAVDTTTGYRSYRVSQLADALVIKRLRDLEVPLADVAEVLRARDPEVTRRVIAAHERTIRDRLRELEDLVDELQRAVDLPSAQTPVFVRTEPEQHVLAITQVVDEPGHDTYAAFLARAYPLLDATLARQRTIPSGPGGALYPPRIEGDSEPVTAIVPVAEPIVLDDRSIADGVVNLLLPSITCAVLTHVGPYHTMDDTYRRLGAWVATNATPIERPVREWYVVSIDEDGALLPEDGLRTEISWPIAAA